MALNINGTTGISGVDGSVSAPAVTGTDSNTGITFPSADTIKFSTGGVERMSITNSGVSGTGIGAGKILQVQSFTKTDTTSFDLSSVYFSTSTQTGIQVSITPSSSSNKILLFGMINVDVAGEQYNIGVVFDKGGSIISAATGDAAGNRKRVTALRDASRTSQYSETINLHYLDTAGS